MERRVGRYTLVKRLAAGGMADIYLGQIHGLRGYERTVVVKTIRQDVVDEDELVQLLIKEARLASLLEHENIVEVIEVGRADGTHFLAMDFVFGRDLRQVRDRCDELGLRFPARHVRTILADVLDALGHAHHDAAFEGRPLQIIHRDVSPQNILIGFDGGVKLLDFGMAKAATEISRTRAGVLKGKYAYMAPERVQFEGEDHRADMFSTGVVLWELLTQQRLFFRSNDYETVKAVTACRVPFAGAVRRDVPWSLAWSAFWALQRSPRWRYQRARSMRAALLRGDPRSRQDARNALADWMAELFEPELVARETFLARARLEPPRFRQVRDAGFELIEEITEPSFRAPPPPPARTATVKSGPGTIVGVAAAVLGARRSFLALFIAFVASSAAIGVLLGRRGQSPVGHGYIYVFADAPAVVVTVGDYEVGPAPVQRVAVLPGRHRIVGRRGGAVRALDVDVAAGENRVVQLNFATPTD